MSTTTQTPLLRNINFRWLLGGGLVSMLGDQFSMLALPWLVLSLTNDSLSWARRGLMGAPRAVLICCGTIADVLPPRVLRLSKYANAAILALSGLLMRPGQCGARVCGCLALGIASAFGIPAGTAILPQACRRRRCRRPSLQMRAPVVLVARPLLAALVLGAHDGGSIPAGALAAPCHRYLTFLFSPGPFGKSACGHSPRRSAGMCAHGGRPGHGVARLPCAAAMPTGRGGVFVMGPLQVALPVWPASACTRPGARLLMGAHGAGTCPHAASSLGGAGCAPLRRTLLPLMRS